MSEPPIDGTSSSDDSLECTQGYITDLERKRLVKSNDQFESSKRLKTDDNSSENEMSVDELNSESEEEDSGAGVSYETDTVPASPTERTDNKNLMFYQNRISSVPCGDFIEDILDKWKDDFQKLEDHHGYIQWLFPTKEKGLNSCAQILNDKEAEIIKKSPILRNRFLRAYKMMLAFFGMKLENEKEGIIGPSELYSSRIAHLNKSFHNNLRITRILKALGELGYEHFKKPFVAFLLYEAFQKKTLENCRESCLKYWIPTIKDERTRELFENLAIRIKRNETASTRKKYW